MKKSSFAQLSEMQVALMGAGLATVAQAENSNRQVAHERWQNKVDALYKEASKKMAAGDRSKKVLESYSRLRRLASPEVKRRF